MKQVHPSQFHHYGLTQQQATVATWGLILAIVGLLVGGTLSRPPGLKVLLFGLAAGLGLTSRAVRKIAISHERLNADLEDISLTAFQEWAYKSMRLDDAATVLEAEVMPASQQVPEYNLSEISGAHHSIIVGPTGSGKSVLVQWLVYRFFQGSNVQVYDSDCRPEDWPGLKVVGRGGDFIGISGAMLSDLELMEQRTQLRGDGKPVGQEEVRICEEFPAVAAELSDLIQSETKGRKPPSVAANWLKRIARRGRKYKIKLILVTQETSVAAMGLEGEGGVRQAFTIFYLGATALEKAHLIKDKDQAREISEYLKLCDRPCLVDHKGRWYAVNIPELPNVAPSAARISAPVSRPENPPEISHPEITPEFRENLERLWGQQFSVSGNSGNDSDYQLFLQVKAHLENGKPVNQVITEVMGYRGRRYQEGRAKLDDLMQRFNGGQYP